MPGELTVTQSMPSRSNEFHRTADVVPLNYETPPEPETRAVTRLMLLGSGLRRFCLGAGVALVIWSAIIMANSRANEEALAMAIGLGLITAAIPMPKWWR